jgi:N-acyl-D-amino-acid deacylase
LAEELFDLTIRGGLLVDGSGAPARSGDVGVRNGRIAALGKVRGPSLREIDASGCVVAPGFIDAHTHYDAQLLWDRGLSISPWHGVTTVVIGNCGFGIAPTPRRQRELVLRTLESVEGMSFEALCAGLGEDWGFESFGEYLDAIERRGTLINVGALVGHTPVRIAALGEQASEREATPDEVAAMSRCVAEALRAGALGFATSKSPTHVGHAGSPVPSRAAALCEIEALAANLGHAGRGVLQVTVGRGLFLRELAEIARRTGRPVSWTALLAGARGMEDHVGLLKRSAELQQQGLAVVPQVSCRPLLFEFQFKAPFVFESLELFRPVSAADAAGKARLYADPAFRARFREAGGLGRRWGDVSVSSCPGRPELEERSVLAIACERRAHPADVALDLALETNLEARFRAALMNTDERAVAELLLHPSVMLGLSDAGAHASQLCDACFSTHLLGHWVRERGTLGVEQAVRLLTSRSAEVFGIEDRGRLALGLAADVTVFDPERVGCGPLRRVHDLPGGVDRLVSDAFGIRAVIVNGELIREGDRDLYADPGAELPGRLLRGGVA